MEIYASDCRKLENIEVSDQQSQTVQILSIKSIGSFNIQFKARFYIVIFSQLAIVAVVFPRF